MNQKLFHILEVVCSEEVYKTISPAMLAIKASAELELHLTLQVKLLSTVAGGLIKIIAALLVNKTHDILDDGKPLTPESEAKGVKLVSELSPEILMFTALFIHFSEAGDRKEPMKKAHALLKTLGHEIPEELISGA